MVKIDWRKVGHGQQPENPGQAGKDERDRSSEKNYRDFKKEMGKIR